MDRAEFITKAHAGVITHYLSIWEEDGKQTEELPELADVITEVLAVTTAGELFAFLAEQCWDIPSAVEFALTILIPDLRPGECGDIPMGGWDT